MITESKIKWFKEIYSQIVEIGIQYAIIENNLDQHETQFGSIVFRDNDFEITVGKTFDYCCGGSYMHYSSDVPYNVLSNINWDYDLKQTMFDKLMAYMKQQEEKKKLEEEQTLKLKQENDAKIVDNFFKTLAEKQEPLPPEFQKVLNDNYWQLLES